ncbi:Ankyrin repeat family [Olea europaea subsp. europaea]|uniref:Ankyrin repeat family n=1 Tax=Olea europaea subsp. europaea TaxID=158383 RepID=A0A8S0UW34_OLEEU|nr:Ankyrin repeat family [Olea europaea subsp. europaea]
MTELESNNIKLNLAGVAIVSEELTEDSFETWKNCLKNYFIGNGLWDVVSKESKPDKTNKHVREKWKKKNALALHAIQLSCGSAIYSKFKDHISAHYVWTHLTERDWAQVRQPAPSSDHDEESHVEDNGSRKHLAYEHLYKAIEEGKWHSIEEILRQNQDAIREIVSSHKDTALHIAILSGHIEIAEKLVITMDAADLEQKNEYGATALSLAAICGAKKLAKAMVCKNKKLVTIETADHEDGHLPVIVAALYGKKEMVRYLYKVTPKDELSPEKGENGVTLLNSLITAEIYDVTSMLLKRYPKLGATPDHGGNYTLKILAHKPSAFLSGTKLSFWERWIYHCFDNQVHFDTLSKILLYSSRVVPEINYIHQRKLVHVEVVKFLSHVVKEVRHLSKLDLEKMDMDTIIYDAIKHGISEFIEEMIKYKPEIIWRKDKKGKTIFSHAIVLRQEKIFSLIFTLGTKKSIMARRHDMFKNNYLHLAAKLSPPPQLQRVSRAALQMQRELQWYKEVESIVQSKLKEEKNAINKTPEMLFTDEHKKLTKDAENWVKSTAGSSMIVGTLIAAVMFTTAFTVPGGNKENSGLPTMLETQRTPFLIFMISNALSMFSSSTSLLMFLGILTARYAEEDFLKSLPTKLIFGLTCLFFSIVTMMASFGSALYLILHEKLSWVTIPIIILSTIPIVLFSILQFPLLIEMTYQTYGSGIFDKPKRKSYFAKFPAGLVWWNK